jgi:hypothetical protein
MKKAKPKVSKDKADKKYSKMDKNCKKKSK